MEGKNNILKHGTNAVAELFRALNLLIDYSVTAHLQNTPELIVKLSHQLQKIETNQQQSLYNHESLKKQQDIFTAQNEMLQNANEMNLQLSKQHFNEVVIEPLVRSILPIITMITDCLNRQDQPEFNKILEAIQTQLTELLSVYDIESFTHNQGDIFDPKTMKPIKMEPTTQEEQDKRLAQSIQPGFMLGHSKLLRMEMVSLYKYEPSEQNTSNSLSERSQS